jgi:hypothetical protein
MKIFALLIGVQLLLLGSCTMFARVEEPAPLTPGQLVIEAGKRLSFEEKRDFRGHCYGYVDSIYREAGFMPDQRHDVYTAGGNGPYAGVDLLMPGDWVMHLNYEFRMIGHSSIFVKWIDRNARMALTLDHAGLNRNEPGKYRPHNMSAVFRIIRPGEPMPVYMARSLQKD